MRTTRAHDAAHAVSGAPEVRSRSRDHIPALDGVRGLAILVILAHNTAFVLNDSETFVVKVVSAAAATGWVGVQLFFVLSGFLITGILIGARSTAGRYRTFYTRRTLRIFPLYYAFLALVLLLGPRLVSLPSWEADVAANQWWYWAYLSNWGAPFGHGIEGLSHFWSLAVEEQFYLIWPVVVFSLTNRGLVRLCAGVLVATPFLRWGLRAWGLPAGAAYEFTVARWDALAAGALVALLLRQPAGRAWLRRAMPWIGSVTLLILFGFLGVERGFHEGDVQVQVLGQTLALVLSAWLVHLAADPSGDTARRVGRLLSADPLRAFGRYSYALYVVHFPVHIVASHYLRSAVNGADGFGRLVRLVGYSGLVTGVSMVLAVLSWHLLEKRFLALKDRLAPRESGVLPATGEGGAG